MGETFAVYYELRPANQLKKFFTKTTSLDHAVGTYLLNVPHTLFQMSSNDSVIAVRHRTRWDIYFAV